jgi:hypothetical protein
LQNLDQNPDPKPDWHQNDANPPIYMLILSQVLHMLEWNIQGAKEKITLFTVIPAYNIFPF